MSGAWWCGAGIVLALVSGVHASEVEAVHCGSDDLAWSMPSRAIKAKASSTPAPATLRWAALHCQFSDPNGIPVTTSFMRDVFERPQDGLLAYFHRMSAGHTAMSLNVAIDVPMGQPASFFTYNSVSELLTKVGETCLQAAEAQVDFSNIDGVALFYNHTFYPQAFGSLFTTTLEGQTRTVRAMWLPALPNCGCTAPSQSAAVVAHELGHTLGLRHANNSDRDWVSTDNNWDLMSNPFGAKRGTIALGPAPRSLHAHQRWQLGWLTDAQVLQLPTDAGAFVETFRLDYAFDAPGVQLAVIDLPGTEDVVLTARTPANHDDSSQQEPFVLIHTHDGARTDPLWVVDTGVPMPQVADSATSYFTSGEAYRHEINGEVLAVDILDSDADGYSVRVSWGPNPNVFLNGFEP